MTFDDMRKAWELRGELHRVHIDLARIYKHLSHKKHIQSIVFSTSDEQMCGIGVIDTKRLPIYAENITALVITALLAKEEEYYTKIRALGATMKDRDWGETDPPDPQSMEGQLLS